jgi:hypothetical protein
MNLCLLCFFLLSLILIKRIRTFSFYYSTPQPIITLSFQSKLRINGPSWQQ